MWKLDFSWHLTTVSRGKGIQNMEIASDTISFFSEHSGHTVNVAFAAETRMTVKEISEDDNCAT